MEKGKLYVKPVVQVVGTIIGGERKLADLKAAIVKWLGKEMPDISPQFLDDRKALTENERAKAESITINLGGGISYLAVDFSHACRQTEGRTWHTEIGFAELPDNKILFGARLTAYTRGLKSSAPTLSTPRIIKQVASDFRLVTDYGCFLNGYPFVIDKDQSDVEVGIQNLVRLLEDKSRTLPVFVVTSPVKNDHMRFAAADPFALARATLGIAHVFYLDRSACTAFSNVIGQELAVFNGSCRIYNSPFDRFTQDLRGHQLFPPPVIQRMGGERVLLKHLTQYAYENSTANRERNEETLPRFADIRSRYFEELRLEEDKLQRERIENKPAEALDVVSEGPKDIIVDDSLVSYDSEVPDLSGVKESEEDKAGNLVRMLSLIKENIALKNLLSSKSEEYERELALQLQAHLEELEAMHTQVEEALGLSSEEERARKVAEGKVVVLTERIEELTEQAAEIELAAPALSKGLFPPLNLIGEWADATFGKQLLITNRARKAASALGTHRDLTTIYQGLSILAKEYVDMRQAKNGDSDRTRDIFTSRLASTNLENRLSMHLDRAGKFGETYFVTVDGNRIFLQHHLTKGNSRDPQSVIRIYFNYDEDEGRVVVGYLPTHLENKLT